MTKAMRAILNALSYGNIEVEASRRLADLKKLDPMRIFLKKLDTEVYNGEYKVPIRLYFPTEKRMEEEKEQSVILFFHGGGWTTESVENYDRVCARMSQSTGQLVASVEYRLAPEHRFPVGLLDCYAAASALYAGRLLPEIPPERITVMGDSAGGNLAAAVCLLGRDRGEFFPKKQVLTSVKMEDYLKLYERNSEDRQNPYFAPMLAKDFTKLPDTLILTAEFDPLRDEGEAFGRKLREAGSRVEVHRIKGALHGYFALGIAHLHVQESFQYINGFLKELA